MHCPLSQIADGGAILWVVILRGLEQKEGGTAPISFISGFEHHQNQSISIKKAFQNWHS